MSAAPSLFYQVGIIVPELEPAMEELSAVLGLSWGPVVAKEFEPSPIRFVFSVEGPPHIELIEGGADGPWSSQGGPRLDHLGFWSPDVAARRRELDGMGLPIEVDGDALGSPFFAYHRAPVSGLRIETVSDSMRDQFYAGLLQR